MFLRGEIIVDGKGNFIPQTILESGIFIPGNGKALIKLKSKNGKYLLAAAQNRGPLKIFELKKDLENIVVQPDDVSADIVFSNGKKQRQELYYGSSFLSQSARFLRPGNNVKSIVITNSKGKTRTLAL